VNNTPDSGNYNHLNRLTVKEIKVLNQMKYGLSNKEIALKLRTTIKAIESCRSRIISKLNARTTIEAMYIAVKKGIIT